MRSGYPQRTTLNAAHYWMVRGLRASLLPGLILVLACAPMVQAAGKADTAYRVLVMLSSDGGAYREVVDGINDALTDVDNVHLDVTTLDQYRNEGAAAARAKRPDLVIAIGTESAKYTFGTNDDVPILAALIARSTYESLARSAPRSRSAPIRVTSAIYLDQPLKRQMSLIRYALPGIRDIGVVLGPVSVDDEARLRAAAGAERFVLTIETIKEEDELFRALSKVLASSDVLLALPDPMVFNRHTAQNILLETYRRQKPIIGYSHTYLSAGALVALYSTPRQIGRQIGEELGVGRAHDLSPPRYPKYFAVEVNHNVARSLGIEIADAAELQARVAEAAGR
jgi:ABC-type uncharacterized transport system substrate-binding protein